MSRRSSGHARSVQPLDTTVLDQVVTGRHGNPHGVLGAHVHDGAVTVRAFRPLAESVVVVHGTHARARSSTSTKASGRASSTSPRCRTTGSR